MHNRPSWYTNEHDGAWDRVKTAFRRDWEQTKHDFGADHARDLDQDAGDTIRQATGAGTDRGRDFDTHEPAFRFGYAARSQYRSSHPSWNDELETRLRSDYGSEFDRDRDHIRSAYEYRETSGGTAMGERVETRR